MANAQTMKEPACYCDEGWVCEAHPDHPWPHDECGGPGMPHMAEGCPYGAENRRIQKENDLLDKLWYPNESSDGKASRS
jgi:hypothetical protein